MDDWNFWREFCHAAALANIDEEDGEDGAEEVEGDVSEDDEDGEDGGGGAMDANIIAWRMMEEGDVSDVFKRSDWVGFMFKFLSKLSQKTECFTGGKNRSFIPDIIDWWGKYVVGGDNL